MIGTNISKLRKQRGLTLSELAERAFISKSYLSNIERNLNQNPSIHVLGKIAAVLHVDLQRLLNSEPEPEKAPQKVEEEWLGFINELKESGIDKEDVQEYKIIIEFIKWQQEQKLK
ncbi:XRE family transcriptional regulator of biofilm formation [Bacillus fengqiuensis]|nr:XRE family transcriptional regulator of biofilm formation [Bacillus fengqiuensis]